MVHLHHDLFGDLRVSIADNISLTEGAVPFRNYLCSFSVDINRDQRVKRQFPSEEDSSKKDRQGIADQIGCRNRNSHPLVQDTPDNIRTAAGSSSQIDQAETNTHDHSPEYRVQEKVAGQCRMKTEKRKTAVRVRTAKGSRPR